MRMRDCGMLIEDCGKFQYVGVCIVFDYGTSYIH